MYRPSESKTSARRISAVERQRFALELRKGGASYSVIATRLGYASASGAYKAVMEALKAITREPAEEVRTLELERLDAMWDAAWNYIATGSAKHIAVALKIQERRSALLGLDAPKTINVNYVIRQEVERMVAAGVIQSSEAEAAVAAAEAIVRGVA